jgi:hypothetical protein
MIMLASKKKVTKRTPSAGGVVRNGMRPTPPKKPAPAPAPVIVTRFKYSKLETPIVGTSRTAKRIQYKILIGGAKLDLPVRRGCYLSLRGTLTDDTGQLVLINGAGVAVAYIDPVLLREDGVPDADTWREVRCTARQILQELDASDDGAVHYLGWVPYPDTPAERLVAVDPLARWWRTPMPAWDHENVVRHSRFSPGLHVAPFRGPNGEMLVVAIGDDGGLDALWPVTGVDTWSLWSHPTPVPNSDFRRVIEYERPREAEVARVDDRMAACDVLLSYTYNDVRTPRRDVVHICPWKGRIDRTAPMVAVTNVMACARMFEEGRDLRTIVESGLSFLRDIREDHAAGERYENVIAYDPHFSITKAVQSPRGQAMLEEAING